MHQPNLLIHYNLIHYSSNMATPNCINEITIASMDHPIIEFITWFYSSTAFWTSMIFGIFLLTFWIRCHLTFSPGKSFELCMWLRLIFVYCISSFLTCYLIFMRGKAFIESDFISYFVFLLTKYIVETHCNTSNVILWLSLVKNFWLHCDGDVIENSPILKRVNLCNLQFD